MPGGASGLSHLITTGNEAVTTAADYLEALVEDPAVRTVAVFLEQLRKPQQFIAVCRRAKSLRKSVVVLKSGRSVAGQQAVMAHTGAVAGEVAVCDAALREAGAIQVFSLDELIETTLVASILPTMLKSHGVAMLSLSGGEIALALDAAEEARLRLPPISVSREALTTALPAGFAIDNPLDLSWAGIYDPSIARRCVEALAQEPDVGVAVLLQDAPGGLGSQQANRYATLLGAVADGAATAGIPLVTVSNISGDPHPDYARMAEAKSVGTLRGTWEGIERAGARAGLACRRAASSSCLSPHGPSEDRDRRRQAQSSRRHSRPQRVRRQGRAGSLRDAVAARTPGRYGPGRRGGGARVRDQGRVEGARPRRRAQVGAGAGAPRHRLAGKGGAGCRRAARQGA